MRWLRTGIALFGLAPAAAPAVTMDWTSIGDPGNACHPSPDGEGGTGCYGGVAYSYSIGTYEVTNAQYAEFLNAKAASDPLGLYDSYMGLTGGAYYGGITRSGSPGSYTYTAIAGRADMPVLYVSFFNALRFANWMNNGQGSGDTETGAYNLYGGTATPNNGDIVTRNFGPGATIVLASEDEWYKAAYYDALSGSYFDYPAVSSTTTVCSAPTALANHANCNYQVADLTIRGSYLGSSSPYGTFDQGGNAAEWNEAFYGALRVIRGGSFGDIPPALQSSGRTRNLPGSDLGFTGFRLANVPAPEPGTAILLMFGMLSLARRRKTA